MTKEQINAVLEAIRSWPREDQEELVDIARAIEARRAGVYVMTAEEQAAVREGLAEADRREFVSDEDMEAFWTRNGKA
jgi:predicted transcriptional regulator